MTHRTDRIYLSPDEPRCSPENDCPQKATCARWLAPLPVGKTIMTGVGMPPPWSPGWCPDYAPASAKAKTVTPKKTVKPAVKGIA